MKEYNHYHTSSIDEEPPQEGTYYSLQYWNNPSKCWAYCGDLNTEGRLYRFLTIPDELQKRIQELEEEIDYLNELGI